MPGRESDLPAVTSRNEIVTIIRHEDNRIDLSPITIRPARPTDAREIAAIFNHAIEHTTASFFTVPRTVEQQLAWLQDRSERYPVLVAEEKTRVVGWVSLESWSDRQAYQFTTEISYYVDPDYQGRGVGGHLIRQILEVARQTGFRNVIAKIAEGNQASVRLIQRAGFTLVGTLQKIGEKFDEELDVFYFQKLLPVGSATGKASGGNSQ